MFDPLVRSSSIGSRTGSLLRSSGSTSSQSAFAFLKQSSIKGEEFTASGDMFGAPPTTIVQQQPQQMGVATHTIQQPMMHMNMMSYVRNFSPKRIIALSLHLVSWHCRMSSLSISILSLPHMCVKLCLTAGCFMHR